MYYLIDLHAGLSHPNIISGKAKKNFFFLNINVFFQIKYINYILITNSIIKFITDTN